MNETMITGIILAGGKSSRMGEEKGLVSFQGKALIEYPIALFEQLGFQIIIIANSSEYNKYGYPVYSDIYTDKGPLAGIYTGIKESTTDWNAVATCDTPFISEDIYKSLKRHKTDSQIVISTYYNKLHPLTALYHSSSEKKILSSIQNNELRVRDLSSKLQTNFVTFEDKYESSFININSKKDIDKWK